MASFFMQASKSPTTYMFGALVPIQLWFFDRLLEEKRERIRALAREVIELSMFCARFSFHVNMY